MQTNQPYTVNHYDQWSNNFFNTHNRYASTPLELSPTLGIPTADTGTLDTFHRVVEALGVPVTIETTETETQPRTELPLTPRGYNQLLRTVAEIIENPLQLMEQIRGITLFTQSAQSLPNAQMDADGVLSFSITPTPLGNTISVLDDVTHASVENTITLNNHSTGQLYSCETNTSLRNRSLFSLHEAVHQALMTPIRNLYQQSSLPVTDTLIYKTTDSILTSYLQQLETSNPECFQQASLLLSSYFTKPARKQEFFTTLFEAIGSEIASRTPITTEIATAVGSTVRHLEARKKALLPNVSTQQAEQLTALVSLIDSTPFNVQHWWEGLNNTEQYAILEAVTQNHVIPSILKPNALDSIKEALTVIDDLQPSLLNNPKPNQQFLTLYQNSCQDEKTFRQLLVKQGLSSLEIDKLISIQQADKAILNQFIGLFMAQADPTQQDITAFITRHNNVLTTTLQALHTTVNQAYNEIPSNQELYVSITQHWKPPNIVQNEQQWLESITPLLDLPTQFLNIIKPLWHTPAKEHQLLIAMCHRLV
jgi:hypothetical protein